MTETDLRAANELQGAIRQAKARAAEPTARPVGQPGSDVFDLATRSQTAGESSPSERGAGVALNAQGGATAPVQPATASPETGRIGSQPQTEAADVFDQASPAGETERHEFSSTQFNLPDDVAQDVRAATAKIDDQDLSPDGKEQQPHITVKYGLHGEDPTELADVLKDQPPITVTLGKTSVFHGDDQDVVKADVESPELHDLNERIAAAMPHVDTHPDYTPHVTLAYVKPGLGDKYAGMDDLEGQQITLHQLTFSSKSGEQTTFKLGDTTVNDSDLSGQPADSARTMPQQGTANEQRIDRNPQAPVGGAGLSAPGPWGRAAIVNWAANRPEMAEQLRRLSATRAVAYFAEQKVQAGFNPQLLLLPQCLDNLLRPLMSEQQAAVA